jgi:hypothetical protein
LVFPFNRQAERKTEMQPHKPGLSPAQALRPGAEQQQAPQIVNAAVLAEPEASPDGFSF